MQYLVLKRGYYVSNHCNQDEEKMLLKSKDVPPCHDLAMNEQYLCGEALDSKLDSPVTNYNRMDMRNVIL